ncbi:MAG TPA: ATP-binding protein, partial [Gaiellaceae bacterium]|nr:ATP-binding protein [Gaiellaceae bacterium]
NLLGELGAVAFAPWVALIGFDAGPFGGGAAAGLSTAFWLAAVLHEDGRTSAFPFTVRITAFVLLGIGPGLVGRRLRASERSLRDVTALQSELIDSTLDGICLTDAAGNPLIANKPLLKIAYEFGMPMEGTVPERLLAISDRVVDPERFRERMLELASSVGAETSDEFEIAGTGRVFRGYTAPVTGRGGELTGRVWTLREVTADRELDRMRDAFVATVSHELRTPLTSISGFLEMMEEEEHGVGETGRKYLQVIRRSTDRLHGLVEDLLLIAQIEANRVELAHDRIDLVELVSRSIEASRPSAVEKHVSLDLAADGPPFVLGDARRLSQVVDNLLSNAVKFTEPGGSVDVTVERHGDAVRLVLADTGVGIPADEHGQVFSRFFRASTATRHAIPGTGLGLAISRALVEQHGGTITLESKEGAGTRVTVILPGEH